MAIDGSEEDAGAAPVDSVEKSNKQADADEAAAKRRKLTGKQVVDDAAVSVDFVPKPDGDGIRTPKARNILKTKGPVPKTGELWFISRASSKLPTMNKFIKAFTLCVFLFLSMFRMRLTCVIAVRVRAFDSEQNIGYRDEQDYREPP